MNRHVALEWGLLLVACLSGSHAQAASPEAYVRSWPQWRGPLANGLVPHGDPPLVWSETQNVKWKISLEGLGHATPIIWDNKIFVLSAVPSSGGNRLAFTVFCYEKATGRQLWKQTAREDQPHQAIQETNSHSSGSPVTDGEHLIVPFGSFGLYGYDLDGRLLWERDFDKSQVTWGEGSSPALVGNTVILIRDNEEASFIHALDKRTGQELWKKPRDEKSSWTTPYVLTRDGRTQVIVNGASAVCSYDSETGGVIWQCSGLGVNVTPMVVVDDKAVYAMSGQRTSPAAMAIALGRTGDLTDTDAVLWKLNRGTPYVSSPLLYDGLLYFFQHKTPILTCLDAATGKPHFAQSRLDGMSDIYASPIGVRDRIYIADLDGTTLVLAKSNELRILATNKLNDRFAASPVVVGDELFLRGHRNLYCLAELKGSR
jgi:outer membrane protein assembly factor BamB